MRRERDRCLKGSEIRCVNIKAKSRTTVRLQKEESLGYAVRDTSGFRTRMWTPLGTRDWQQEIWFSKQFLTPPFLVGAKIKFASRGGTSDFRECPPLERFRGFKADLLRKAFCPTRCTHLRFANNKGSSAGTQLRAETAVKSVSSRGRETSSGLTRNAPSRLFLRSSFPGLCGKTIWIRNTKKNKRAWSRCNSFVSTEEKNMRLSPWGEAEQVRNSSLTHLKFWLFSRLGVAGPENPTSTWKLTPNSFSVVRHRTWDNLGCFQKN